MLNVRAKMTEFAYQMATSKVTILLCVKLCYHKFYLFVIFCVENPNLFLLYISSFIFINLLKLSFCLEKLHTDRVNITEPFIKISCGNSWYGNHNPRDLGYSA